MRVAGLALALAVLLGAPARAQAPLVVVELFTSQGCSSCPPADAFLLDLARERADLLPLAFHVTYWNSLGWRDPFSLEAATARQRYYARILPGTELYTPQIVVNGQTDVVGSDRAAAEAAFRRAVAGTQAVARLARTPQGIRVAVDAGHGAGTILLIGFDHRHQTAVGRGENGGRTLTEANIVRSATQVGRWTGQKLDLQLAAPAGEDAAVLVQADDGRILGAARL